MEPLVLTVDMAGLPQAWVELEEAVTYHAKHLVAWSVGEHVREYRGGSWERVSKERLTSIDLSADLVDYEERRIQDRAKLRAMINYCQSAQCRTKYILEYFGEDFEPEWECGNCDACDGIEIGSRRRYAVAAL